MVAASVSNNNASSFDNKPSSTLQLVVASVDQILIAKSDKTSQASLSVALAECRKANKFSKISTSDKAINYDADVVGNEDEMVAVEAAVTVQLVVKSIPILIPEGAQAETKQPSLTYSILLNLIVFFLLSSFENDFVLQANEDSQLHGRRATSKNQQTQCKCVAKHKPTNCLIDLWQCRMEIDETTN